MRQIAAILLFSSLAPTLANAQVPESRYRHLARGVNLTRWFQYGSPQTYGPSERDLLRNAGFTAIRLPVAPQYLLPRWASPTTITANLAKLDAAIDLFLNARIAVQLDLQADAEFLDYYLATPGSPGELIELWRSLATRYSDRDPDLLFFEILNEPDDRFTADSWDQTQFAALSAIRSVAPLHTVLLSPVAWSSVEALLNSTPPADDPNVIYVTHYYAPTAFTHQGATWTNRPGVADLRGLPFPASLEVPDQSTPAATDLADQYQIEGWNYERIEADFTLIADWATRNNTRVIVNEFGVYKPYAPPESRARWLRDVRMAIETFGLAWTYWDYNAGFDLVEKDGGKTRIDPAVAEALGLH